MIENNLDIHQAVVLYYLYFTCSSTNSKLEENRLREDGRSWTWVSLKKISEMVPIVGIKSTSAISLRIKTLEDAGFIKTKEVVGKRLYIALEPKIDTLFVQTKGMDESLRGDEGSERLEIRVKPETLRADETISIQDVSDKLTKTPYSPPEGDGEKIFKFWNSLQTAKDVKCFNPRNTTASKKLLPTCRKINPALESVFKKLKAKNYTFDDFHMAVLKYVNDIVNRNPDNDRSDYCSHRFSLYEFMKQSNGFEKFLNK